MDKFEDRVEENPAYETGYNDGYDAGVLEGEKKALCLVSRISDLEKTLEMVLDCLSNLHHDVKNAY